MELAPSIRCVDEVPAHACKFSVRRLAHVWREPVPHLAAQDVLQATLPWACTEDQMLEEIRRSPGWFRESVPSDLAEATPGTAQSKGPLTSNGRHGRHGDGIVRLSAALVAACAANAQGISFLLRALIVQSAAPHCQHQSGGDSLLPRSCRAAVRSQKTNPNRNYNY